MDFANESYVRVYTRDTTTWKRMGWEGQCTLMQLFRKVDRAGVLEIDSMSPGEAVAMHAGGPPDFCERGMRKLIELGVVEHRGTTLVLPNFLEAQEATKSDRLRSKEYRHRRRSQAMGEPSQPVTAPSPTVTSASREITEHHTPPRGVTLCSAVPSSAGALLPIAEKSLLSGDGLKTWILNEHARRYYALRTRPPGRLDREEMAGKLASWVEGASGAYKLGNQELAAKILTGLFASSTARDEGGWSISWAVQNPEEFCGLPDGSALPPRKARPDEAEANKRAEVASQTARLQKEFAERIKKARDERDDYTVNRLITERDLRISKIQAQAS